MIEMFVAIVQQQGMTQAAHHLGTTQSAVSQAITAIESKLGTPLLDRSVRPMQLTLFGTTFYERALELLRGARELEQVVDLRHGERLPLLRIGMVDSFASTVGPHLLRELAPLATRWSVASGVEQTSRSALTTQTADLVITSEEIASTPELLVYPLLQEPLLIVAPRDAPPRRGGLAALGKTLPLIRYSAHGFLGRQVEAYLQHVGIALPRQYELDTSDAVLALVKAGIGWTISTPLCVLKTQRAIEDFRYLPLPAPRWVRRIRLLAHRDRHAALWQRVAETCRSLLAEEWLQPMRELAPWDHMARVDRDDRRRHARRR
jgi:DNA-binding transcriptional LysR family regulator